MLHVDHASCGGNSRNDTAIFVVDSAAYPTVTGVISGMVNPRATSLEVKYTTEVCDASTEGLH